MTLACSLALVLLPSAPADVIVVDAAGAGEFTDLQAAIAAAAEDDVLLVRPGTYGPAQIDGKGLSLVADGGGPVSVQGGLSVRQLMQDQQVALIGLRCEGGNGAGEQRAGLTIEANDGVVRVDHCVLIGADGVFYSLDAEGAPGARIEDAAGVSLAHCELRGGDGDQSFSGGDDNRGGEGVWASHSALALYDCDASGGNGGPGSFEGCDLGGAAGHGLHLMESAATVSGSLVLGGDGGGDGLFLRSPLTHAFRIAVAPNVLGQDRLVSLVDLVAHRLTDEVRRDRVAVESVCLKNVPLLLTVVVLRVRALDVEVIAPASELEAFIAEALGFLREDFEGQVGPLASEQADGAGHGVRFG